MQTKLQTLIQQGLVWHGQVTDNQTATLSSGFSSLDTALGGGCH